MLGDRPFVLLERNGLGISAECKAGGAAGGIGARVTASAERRESGMGCPNYFWGSDRRMDATEQKTILVVEDNIDNRRILVYRLRRIGEFRILEASNGQEALEVVAKEPPDLIFMDLKMPVMDGWEATQRIRAQEKGRRTPIIALTAQAMAGDEQKALAAGCDDYVAKPIVDPNIVREKMERLLGRLAKEPRGN